MKNNWWLNQAITRAEHDRLVEKSGRSLTEPLEMRRHTKNSPHPEGGVTGQSRPKRAGHANA